MSKQRARLSPSYGEPAPYLNYSEQSPFRHTRLDIAPTDDDVHGSGSPDETILNQRPAYCLQEPPTEVVITDIASHEKHSSLFAKNSPAGFELMDIRGI